MYLRKKTPVLEKINIDQPIEEIFLRFADRPNTALLNSSLETDAARFSFIGIEPFLVLTSKENKKNPFDELNSVIKAYNVANESHFPFVAGGIGYLSYDLKDVLEELPQKAKDDLSLPDLYFVFYQAILIYDKLKPNELYVSILDIENCKKVSELMKEIKKIINNEIKIDSCFRRNDSKVMPAFVIPARAPREAWSGIHNLESNFTKQNYIKAVEKIIDYIRAGDIYQACLSQRFKTKWAHDPYELYQSLNRINPAPFSAYLNFEPAKIISSSPELFLRLRNGVLETRPMKGTRPRGKSREEDAKLKNELKESSKDAAELLMIVDLERNDLGRVCVPGSIELVEHRRIETYPTVFQTISVVKGKIRQDVSIVNAIKAAFPGGSITGCPKIRAMEIIDELEPTRRSVYTGSIGYISFHNTMDLNIAIRTIITKGKDIYFQAGGGITVYSDPEREYVETLDKARALVKACRGRFSSLQLISTKAVTNL